MPELIHADLYCDDPACTPNGEPNHWIPDSWADEAEEAALEIQAWNERLITDA